MRLVPSCRLCRCCQGAAGHETSVQSIPSLPPFSLGVFVWVRPDPTAPDPGCRTPPGVRGSRCQMSRRAGCLRGAGPRPATAQTYHWERANSTVSWDLPPSWLETSRATSWATSHLPSSLSVPQNGHETGQAAGPGLLPCLQAGSGLGTGRERAGNGQGAGWEGAGNGQGAGSPASRQ